jgi:23S rRNA (cytidine1920-2'-O)/16S rRNA (cytidine1409-2'-O)-methyltransferase
LAERLDKRIMALGLAQSRERAQMLIGAGLVTVDGRIAEKSSERVEEGADVVVTGEAMPYVGRGGLKLEAALKQFRVNVRDAVCIDVGASTGGFTDCLLQRGAAKVVAIEVGHSQMAESIANDSRVELREGLNARYLSPEQFDGQFDIAVIDVSFISLTLVLPAVAPLVRPGGHIIALVKPEFEAGREAVGAKGIVRSAEARRKALQKVVDFAKDELKLELRGTMPSPDIGGGGNRETFANFRVPPLPREASTSLEQDLDPTISNISEQPKEK